jgi:hypothetical protein
VYLIITEHYQWQTADLRLDSRFLGWIYDCHVQVFRFHEGRFQRINVYTEERKGSKCLFFAHEWVDVRDTPPS